MIFSVHTPLLGGKVSETMAAHIILSFFFAITGYFASGRIAGTLPPDALQDIANSGTITLAMTQGEMWEIFQHNLVFLLVLSVIPIINSVLIVAQSFMLGIFAYLIADLSWATQFEMYYRHAILEVIALLIAVSTSYIWLYAIAHFVNSPGRDTLKLRVNLRLLPATYIAVLVLTLIAAILEGSAIVHI